MNYHKIDGVKEIGGSQLSKHTVTSAEATAGVIALEFDDLPAVEIYLTQVFRSGVKIVDGSTYTVSGNTLTITEDATTPTWDFTAGDVVMVQAAGVSTE